MLLPSFAGVYDAATAALMARTIGLAKFRNKLMGTQQSAWFIRALRDRLGRVFPPVTDLWGNPKSLNRRGRGQIYAAIDCITQATIPAPNKIPRFFFASGRMSVEPSTGACACESGRNLVAKRIALDALSGRNTLRTFDRVLLAI